MPRLAYLSSTPCLPVCLKLTAVSLAVPDFCLNLRACLPRHACCLSACLSLPASPFRRNSLPASHCLPYLIDMPASPNLNASRRLPRPTYQNLPACLALPAFLLVSPCQPKPKPRYRLGFNSASAYSCLNTASRGRDSNRICLGLNLASPRPRLRPRVGLGSS
jgi:hypothetical protein